MLDRFVNFPHIVKAITETFSFKDLINSAIINHAWNDVVSPVLYLDVVTYRMHRIPQPESPHFSVVTTHYFTTSERLQALTKHAHHIRAITCKGAQSLLTLLEAGCSNLLEVNFVSEEQNWGFGLLVKLVSQNPNLCAVSLEDLNGKIEGQLGQLQWFVSLLGDYPKITCLYMEGVHLYADDALQAALARRLDLLKKENVKCLTFVRRVTRSRRSDLSEAGSRPFWPGREQTIFAKNSIGLEDRRSNGRFDLQYGQGFNTYDILAVLMKGEIRDMAGEHYFIPELKKLSQLREVQLKRVHIDLPDLLELLHDPPASLTAVDLTVGNFCGDYENIAQALYPSVGSSHGLSSRILGLSSLLREMGFSTRISMKRLLQFLGACPNLQVLSANEVFVGGRESNFLPEVSTTWATRQLRKLRLGIRLEGFPNDAGDMRQVPEGAKEVALAFASMIAPSFMEQLGHQRGLQELDLSFNAAYRCGVSPFLQLIVGPPNGLDQLSKLEHLEYFSCAGIMHEVGASELAWMKEHWPRLKRIHLPVFDVKDKSQLEWHSFNDMVLPDYRSYFPSLEVVKILGKYYACRCGKVRDECFICRGF